MTTEQSLPAPEIQRAAPPQILTATPHGRALLFTLEAGQGIPPHRHPGSQTILAVLSGQIEVRTHTTQTLSAGEVVTHDGNGQISVVARQPGRVLITLLGG